MNIEDPWSPEVLEEDERRLAEFEQTRMGVPWDEVQAWMLSWGKLRPMDIPLLLDSTLVV